MVERDDRIVADSGAVVRVHQEDLCRALSVHPDRRYEVDGGPGAEQFGRFIREVAGDRDATRFFATLVHNWLVLATDGQAKNYSLLLSAIGRDDVGAWPQPTAKPCHTSRPRCAHVH